MSSVSTRRKSKPLRHSWDLGTLRGALMRIPRRTLVLWLIASALGLFLLPLTLFASSVQDEVSTLEGDMEAAVSAQTTMPTIAPRVLGLTKQLSQVQAVASEIKAVYPTLAAGSIEWTAVMTALGNYDPNRIAIEGMRQVENRITLNGSATDEGSILDYVTLLQSSGVFANVVLQSVQLADTQAITMTVAPALIAPTATITPTATLSPTLTLEDDYEPDLENPPYYYLGQFQIHTFYPDGDIDRIVFLAKAGRYYRIATENLANGVDTTLQVTGGNIVLFNDDYKNGVLSSEVILATPPQDTIITVTLSNRGQFGVAQHYSLLIEGISPTPTPTPTVTLTPPLLPTITSAPPTTLPTSQPIFTTIPTPFITLLPLPTATPYIIIVTPIPPTQPPLPTATPTHLPPPTDLPTVVPPTDLPTILPPTDVPTSIPPTATPIPIFEVTGAALDVSPATSTTCPETFNFAGTVTARGTGSVTFLFERSDGSSSAEQTLVFGGDGSQPVSDAWMLPGAPGFTFNGWERIRITSPNALTSNQADFALVCPPDPIPTTGAKSQELERKSSHNVVWIIPDLTSSQGPAGGGLLRPRPNSTPVSVARALEQMPIRFVIILELKAGLR